MLNKFILAILGILGGLVSGYIILTFFLHSPVTNDSLLSQIETSVNHKSQIIGFLPYWLVANADKNYMQYITTLTYFGLTVSPDGSIQKFINPGEEEPGWYTLHSGKMDNYFKEAKKNNVKKSLLVFSGDEETIGQLISDPIPHAQNLMKEVSPIMKEYSFTDLNVDIESVNVASEEARQNFTLFLSEVKKEMDQQNLGTLTIDVSPTALIKNYLIDVNKVSNIIDYVVLMTYDYHYPGSSVTGPVSPVGGVETDAEFDSETGVKEALKILPSSKILLGTPLYGYEWESIEDSPRSGVIPGTGIAASNRRVEGLLASCATCSAKKDAIAKESYVIYKDEQTQTYHQFFFPDGDATIGKIKLAESYKLGGLALWALGYEGDRILDPLRDYKNH